MAETIRKNEKCFIGNPTCGYGYESAKLCFVACPSDDKYKYKLGLIEDIIKAQRYECHIALKRINPATSAFCTKICSKIIQSQFCIVLLDLSTKKEKKKKMEYPNPNVYLEYGMMLAQNKHIIPLIDAKYKLPFNIALLDTIKYKKANFRKKLTEAVDNAIKKFSEKESKKYDIGFGLSKEKPQKAIPDAGEIVITQDDVLDAFKKIPDLKEEGIKKYLKAAHGHLLRNGIVTKRQLNALISSDAVLDTLRTLYIEELLRPKGTPLDPIAVATWGANLFTYGTANNVIAAIRRRLRQSPEYRRKHA